MCSQEVANQLPRSQAGNPPCLCGLGRMSLIREPTLQNLGAFTKKFFKNLDVW